MNRFVLVGVVCALGLSGVGAASAVAPDRVSVSPVVGSVDRGHLTGEAGGPPPAVRLDPKDASAVQVVSDTVLRVPARVPFTDLTAGQALLVPRPKSPQGVLIRGIASIEDTGDGGLLLTGEPMGLLDVAQDVHANLSWDETDVAGGPGNRLGLGAELDKDFDLGSFHESATFGSAPATLVADVAMTNKLNLNLRVDGGVFPTRIDAVATASLSSDLTSTLTASASGSWSKTVPLVTDVPLTCAPLPYGLGQICPTVGVDLYAEASIGVVGSVKSSYHAKFGGQLTLSNGDVSTGAAPGSGYSFSQTRDLNGTASAKVTPLLDVQFHYMTVDGPSLNVAVGPFVDFTADTSKNPWWSFGWGINGKFGIDGGSWLDKQYESPLYELWRSPTPLAKAPGAYTGLVVDPAFAQIRRNQTVKLDAQKIASGTPTPADVTWEVLGSGHGTISSAGMYTAPATAGTYRVKASEPGTQNTTVAFINVLPDPPGAPAAVSAVPGLRSAVISVTVGEDGGAPVDEIAVRKAGSTDAGRVYAYPNEDGVFGFSGLPAKSAVALQVRLHNPGGWGPWKTTNTVTPYGPTVISALKLLYSNRYSPVFNTNWKKMAYLTAPGVSPVKVKDDSTGKTFVASKTPAGQPLTVVAGDFTFDPTGRYLAFASGMTVYVRDLAHAKTTIWPNACTDFNGPDNLNLAAGVLVYTCGGTGDVYLTRNGGTSRQITALGVEQAGVDGLALSDDGKVLVYTEFRPDDAAYEGDTDGVAYLLRRVLATGATTEYALPSNSVLRGHLPDDNVDGLTVNTTGSKFAVINRTSVIVGTFTPGGAVDTDSIQSAPLDGFGHDVNYDVDIAMSGDGKFTAVMTGTDGYYQTAGVWLLDSRSGWVTRQSICLVGSGTTSNYYYSYDAAVDIRGTQVITACDPGTERSGGKVGIYKAALHERAG